MNKKKGAGSPAVALLTGGKPGSFADEFLMCSAARGGSQTRYFAQGSLFKRGTSSHGNSKRQYTHSLSNVLAR